MAGSTMLPAFLHLEIQKNNQIFAVSNTNAQRNLLYFALMQSIVVLLFVLRMLSFPFQICLIFLKGFLVVRS